MSKYDELKIVLVRLRRIRFICTSLPVLLTAVLALYYVNWSGYWFAGAAVTLTTVLVGPAVLHRALAWLSDPYKSVATEMRAVEQQTACLRRAVERIYDSYPARPKGKQFKIAYALNGRSVKDFEKAMAIGMRYEGKEVFVTAFVRKDTVVRVTASIGSPYRCAAADNPNKWPEHYRRLQCDELRQYHNHLENRNHTEPSSQDFSTVAALEAVLKPAEIRLQSFIVFWNEIYEWRVLRYGSDRSTTLACIFDAAA